MEVYGKTITGLGPHVCADLGIVVGGRGAEQHGKVDIPQQRGKSQRRIQRGGVGQVFPDPPGKSQVIWGSIGNKQLDASLEKVGPPPPPHLEKVGPPPEP